MSLVGDWGCEYCGATFITCGQLAIHIHDQHLGQPFPNCCDNDTNCVTLFGPGYGCVEGICVQLVETYPMVIAAEAILEGYPAVAIQIGFTINGVSKSTLYAESLAEGRYNFRFPAQINYEGKTYTLLGNNEFYIDHPDNSETYFKASYFSYLPPPPIRVRFNATDTCLVDWGEGPQEYGSLLVEPGTNVTVEAVPCEGYNFAFWRRNDVKVSTRNPETFTIIEDETKIDAIFTEENGGWPEWPEIPWKPILIVGGALAAAILLSKR